MKIALVLALIWAAASLGSALAQNGEVSAREAYDKGDYATAVAAWRRAAEAGDAKAQVNLGHMYALGQGVRKDEAAAISWFRRAADQGSAVAHYNLGVLYETGSRQDLATAARHYRIAAEAGWTASQTALGRLYRDGRGVKQDYREAAKWFEEAAEDNDAQAQFMLGVFYANGWGVARDIGGMLEWTRRAARQGHPEALFHMGLAYDTGFGLVRNPAYAAQFYEVAANKGNLRAKARLGEMYFQGVGVERDLHRAIGLLNEAAAAGETPALFHLGQAYYFGEGVKRDLDRGIAYWRRAAEKGHARAEFSLGGAYAAGVGVGRDPQAAVEWYRRAAERGYVPAYDALGRAYRTGRGVTRDDAEAARWLLKAARGGQRDAQLTLARMYLTGDGVAANHEAALRWINEAIRLGSADAVAELAELHLSGRGVERDPGRALQLLREAAEKGLKSAQTRIADLLAEGRLVPADPEGAAGWYRRLADVGDAHGTAMLAAFQLEGRGGFAPDAKRAAELFRIAADLGSVQAADALAALHLEGRGVEKDLAKAARWYDRAAAEGDFTANYALGGMYRDGRGVDPDLDAAERHYAAALAAREASDGQSAPSLVQPLRRLAELNHDRGRGERAATYYRRALGILADDGDRSAYLETLAGLVAVYRDQNRPEEAARAVADALTSLGTGAGESAAVFRSGLAALYEDLGLNREAMEIYAGVVTAMEKAGRAGPGYRYALAARGRALARLGRDAEAEADLVRALILMERHRRDGFAIQHAGALDDYGRLLVRLGHFGEAVAAFEKAERLVGGLDPLPYPTGFAVARDFALAYEKEGMIEPALAVLRRALRGPAVRDRGLAASAPAETARLAPDVSGLRRQYLRLLTTRPVSAVRRAEAFEAMQEVAFSTPSPLSRRIVARMVAADDGLARLLGQRRRGLAARHRIERRLAGPVAGFGRLGASAMEAAFAELRRLNSGLDALAETIRRRYPNAAALLSPPPVALAAARALLDSDEALIATLTAGEGIHVWVVTAKGSRYHRVALRPDEIARIVGRLRVALEAPRDPLSGNANLYPLDLAAMLYRRLIGPAASMLSGVTHVIHAPGGALRRLPLSVLVADLAASSADDAADVMSAPPDPVESGVAVYRGVVWFIDKFAYSRVPSPWALHELRGAGEGRIAPKAFVGIGGPVLDEPTKLADLGGFPDSASPLRVMARRLGAPDGDYGLAIEAEESAIKSLDLKKFRMIGFTTPGVVAGELPGLAEPALLLSAPASASGGDGFLTASEIADLDLDADLVVLGMRRPGGEAGAAWLSAVGEAFLRAGARSVMAAGWPVERDAAAAFAAGMFARRGGRGRSRVAGLARRAALEVLSDETRPARFAHPGYWGAFAIIGDGGRRL